jgi:hypothetical protein
MTQFNLGCSLRQFRLEPSPNVLAVVTVLLLKEPESFFGGQLGDSSEVSHAETIQNLDTLKLALSQAKRAFQRFSR